MKDVDEFCKIEFMDDRSIILLGWTLFEHLSLRIQSLPNNINRIEGSSPIFRVGFHTYSLSFSGFIINILNFASFLTISKVTYEHFPIMYNNISCT